MKNFTFIFILLISLTTYGQTDNVGTAAVKAHIVQTIQIKDGTTALDFGSMKASTGGNVRIATDGTRTFSNADMQVATNLSTPSAAQFEVTAEDGFAYNIHIPSIDLKHSVTPTGPTMRVNFSQEIDSETDGNVNGTGSAQTLYVGGLLDVGASQPAGTYEGVVTVTVAYQ